MLEGGLAEVDRDRCRDARDRLSTRSVRAGRRRRHRREPGRRDRHLRGLLRRSAVSAGAGPAARRRRRSARAQDVRRLLRLRGRRHARRGRGPRCVARSSAVPRVARLDAAQIEARILAAIVNEAASAVADGVASPEAIDTAMRLATNWPEGPLAWGERIGLPSVVHSLDALHATVPDGRYRVTPLLRVARGQRRDRSSPLETDACRSSGRYRAVIFDMDGLLLDTETLWHAGRGRALRAPRRRRSRTRTRWRVIGTNFEVTSRYFAERLGWPFERRCRARPGDASPSCTTWCASRSMRGPAPSS